MDNTIDNIVTYANILAVTRTILKNVGYEFQAPLDDSTLTEVVSSCVLQGVEDVIKGKTA